MKKIIVVHGDKGGAGKSTFASLVADYALAHFGSVGLVEGDITIMDVAPRFGAVPGVQGIAVDLARPDMSEDAVIALFSKIEADIDAEITVVNTPASASKTIDAQADLIAPALRDLGYELTVAWLVAETEDSARLAMTSQLCAVADQRVAVLNERFKKADTLPWARHDARRAWLSSGGTEVVLPGIAERIADRMRPVAMPYSHIADATDLGLTTIERHAIRRWVHQAWAQSVAPIFQEADHE